MDPRAQTDAVGIDEIEAAAATIAPHVRVTPVLPAREISNRVGADVGLKAENLQRTGSFKVRGAVNKVAALDAGRTRAAGWSPRAPATTRRRSRSRPAAATRRRRW